MGAQPVIKYFKIKVGLLFPTWGFWGPEILRIPKWEKLEFIKINC